MGGGAVMTPLLIFLFGFKPTLAVGTDILHGASSRASAPSATAGWAPFTRI